MVVHHEPWFRCQPEDLLFNYQLIAVSLLGSLRWNHGISREVRETTQLWAKPTLERLIPRVKRSLGLLK
jgi:hypothetical protein